MAVNEDDTLTLGLVRVFYVYSVSRLISIKHLSGWAWQRLQRRCVRPAG